MNIIKTIDIQFQRMRIRKWSRLFFFFDVHETIIYPDYDNKQPIKFYLYAKDVLQYLSGRDDISISLYTCSYPKEIQKYIKFFQKNNIEFEYVNRNPDAENTMYGYYEDKPYFNVLFDDKAGFDAENDWFLLKQYFKI